MRTNVESDIDDRGFTRRANAPADARNIAPHDAQPADARRDFWNGLILIVAVAALWLACVPFANVPVNDDFSYAFTVKRLIETGRFTFNGWSTAMLGVQALWAVPFVKAFGMNNDALRLSVLPWSMACSILAYALHRRFGIAPIWSLFATLLLVASPLFTPWSASFMTDVPGLTLTLAMLLTFVALRSAWSSKRVATLAITFAVLGVLAGSVRQSAIPLAAVAYAFELWQRRRDRTRFVIVLVVALACGACMAAMLKWASSQDYYLPEMRPGLSMMPGALGNLLRLFLDGLLYALPLLLALVPVALPAVRQRAIAFVLPVLVIVLAMLSHTPLLRAPWTGNTIMPTGLLEDWIDAPGHRPIVIGEPLRIALAALVAWMIGMAGIVVQRDAGRWWASFRRRWRSFDAKESALTGMLILALAYLCLLIPRAAYRLVFDRYLLVVIPIASIAICFGWRDRLNRTRPALAAWLVLGLFAVGGVAVTFDHFAELRARLAVAGLLEREGVPRTWMVNSIGFDAWSQLEVAGHLNDDRIIRPAGAYRPDPLKKEKSEVYWFLPQLPGVEPHWLVMNVRSPADVLPDDRMFRFRALLPPRQRVLVIRHQPWPPTTAATMPDNASATANVPIVR